MSRGWNTLEDDLLALGKRLGHSELSERHLALLVAERLRADGVELAPDTVDVLRSGLPPEGVDVPTGLSPELKTLVDSIRGDDDAKALVARVSGAPLPAAKSAPETAAAATADPATAAADLQQALDDLDALVGLTVVKSRVRELVAMQQVNESRLRQSLPPLTTGLHLVFTGDPGTGKTTVARIIARIYRALGVLSSGHLVETGRSDLVAGYVGQTALKTKEVLRRARGGVLFIDEAYSLAGDSTQDFVGEAVATLVKDMEDHRDDLAVVAAGYRTEMEGFIESNPGLRSRFQTFIDFPNYTPDELIEIFQRLARDQRVEAGQEVQDAVAVHLRTVTHAGSAGNARYVRGLFEEMTNRLAIRAAADGIVEDHEVLAFHADDVPAPVEDSRRLQIGFQS